MVYLGPLLAAVILWATWRRRPGEPDDIGRLLGTVAALAFVGGALVSGITMAVYWNHPHFVLVRAAVPDFWQKPQFVIPLVGLGLFAVACLVWPRWLLGRAPAVLIGFVALLLVIVPWLRPIRPEAFLFPPSHYVARTAAGCVLWALLVAMWIHVAFPDSRLALLACLRRPEVGRRLAAATFALVLAAAVPDRAITHLWRGYLGFMRATGRVALRDREGRRPADERLAQRPVQPGVDPAGAQRRLAHQAGRGDRRRRSELPRRMAVRSRLRNPAAPLWIRLARLRAAPMDKAQQLFAQGFALQQKGQAEEAAALYERVLAQSPAHFDALHLLGVIRFQSGQLERALELLDRAIALNPGVAAAHTNRGALLHELGRFDEAVASHDKAIACKPDYATASYNRGNTAVRARALRGSRRQLRSGDRVPARIRGGLLQSRQCAGEARAPRPSARQSRQGDCAPANLSRSLPEPGQCPERG